MKSTKTCSNEGCTNSYTQYNSLQAWCSPQCGFEISQRKLQQKEYIEAIRGEVKKPKESLGHEHELTQSAFNKWVREVKEKDATCCISCGAARGTFKEQAGHYKTVGSSGILRYEPDNCHLQCFQCNGPLSGNIGQYTPNLIAKIGQERFDYLDATAGRVKKWTIAEVKNLRLMYLKKIRNGEL